MQQIPGQKSSSSVRSFQIDTHEFAEAPSMKCIEQLIQNNESQVGLFHLDAYGKYCPQQGTIEYHHEVVLYEELLSPTKVSKLTIEGTNPSYLVKKSLMKSKLLTPMAHTFAIREQIIHGELSREDHPNILKLHSYSSSEESYDLYLEHADMGEYLSSKVLENFTPLGEIELKEVSQQLLKALAFIHSKSIIHCDLKLENILLKSQADHSPCVKLADFGLSHKLQPNSNCAYMSALCGTFGYIAPEQRPQSYISTAVDMYSFGILLHEMAVAYKPQFLSKKEGRLSFREADWRGVERKKELQELICLCLRGNPKERPTAQGALEHEYYL